MKKVLLKLAIFLLIPIVAIEACCRLAVSGDFYEESWYPSLGKAFATTEQAVLLIGSSKTAAAIDGEQLTRFLTEKLGHPVTVLNLGLGYSTFVEHYLGVERLIEQRKSLKNVIVVLECQRGLPGNEQWTGQWIHADAPQMIMPLLGPEDLGRMWSQSSVPVSTKISVTLGAYLLSVRYFNRLRRRVESLPSKILFPESFRQKYDIAEVGGIAANELAVDLARQTVKADLKLPHVKSAPVDLNGFDAVFSSLVNLCQTNGAQVYVYEPPSFEDAQRRSECALQYANFKDYCRQKNIESLPLKVKFSQEDFPDLMHLSKSKRPEFTQNLADQLWRCYQQKKSVH